MSHRRWIISSHPINGTGCIHDCYSSFHPPPHPPHLPATAFIAVVSAAFAVLFLVLTYYIVLFRRRRADRVDSGDHLPSDPDGADADYHVWRIRTDGLDESTINSISVKPYIAGGGATADCSVCLGEFRDGELVRLLPACDHAFHVSCIDTWLRAHINCPLCRARIIGHSDSGGGSLGSVASDGDALVSDRRVSGDLEDDQGREIRTVDVTDSSMDCAEHSILPASRDLPGNGLQLVCQSNSMDSLPESDLVVRLDRDGSFQEEKKDQELYHSDEGMVNEKKGKVGSSSKGDEQQKCLAEIGGDSTSVSGGMFFFSRYGRARSSSVLPL